MATNSRSDRPEVRHLALYFRGASVHIAPGSCEFVLDSSAGGNFIGLISPSAFPALLVYAQELVLAEWHDLGRVCSPTVPSSFPRGGKAWQKSRLRGKARNRVGLSELLIHDVRRTAARNMIRSGVPEKQPMLISGHKTRSMFNRYDIVDERDIKQ